MHQIAKREVFQHLRFPFEKGKNRFSDADLLRLHAAFFEHLPVFKNLSQMVIRDFRGIGTNAHPNQFLSVDAIRQKKEGRPTYPWKLENLIHSSPDVA